MAKKSIVIEALGKKQTIEQWAEEKGLNQKTLYGRWIRTKGRPVKLNDQQANHMFRVVDYVHPSIREQLRLILPDGVEMSISEIVKAPWCEVKRTSVERRFANTTGPMHRKDFKALPRKQKAEAEKRLGGPSREWKMLSDKKNTGKGKGSIPDSEWLEMTVRGKHKSSFAALLDA